MIYVLYGAILVIAFGTIASIVIPVELAARR